MFEKIAKLQVVENSWKAQIKFFGYCSIVLDFLILLQVLHLWLQTFQGSLNKYCVVVLCSHNIPWEAIVKKLITYEAYDIFSSKYNIVFYIYMNFYNFESYPKNCSLCVVIMVFWTKRNFTFETFVKFVRRRYIICNISKNVHSLRNMWIAQNCAETAPFRKTSTPWN